MLRTHTRASGSGWIAVVAAVMLFFGIGSVVTAQRDNQDNQNQGSQQTTSESQDRSENSDKLSAQMQDHVLANDLIGTSVYSQQGDELGKLQDIVFDEQHRNISYVVLSSGGFLGIGAKRHAVPWDMVNANLSQDRVTIPIDKAMLDEKEGFGDDWPTSEHDPRVLSSSGSGSISPGESSTSSSSSSGTSSWSTTDQTGSQSSSSPTYGGMDPEQAFDARKASNMIGMNVELSSSRSGMEGSGSDDMNRTSPRPGTSQPPSGGADQPADDDEAGVYDDDASVGRRTEPSTGAGIDEENRNYGAVDEDQFGETAGQIDDLLLSKSEGRLEMAIIQPNDDFFENMGDDQMLAAPWARISVLPTQNIAIANLTKSEAQQLTVQEDNLGRLDDDQFRRDFYSAVGEDMAAAGMTLGSIDGTDGRTNGSTNGSTNGHMNGSSKDGHMNGSGTDGSYGSQNQQSQQNRSDTSRTGSQDGRMGQGTQNGQMGQNGDMQKWSDFAAQCLGQELDKSDETIEGTVHNVGTMYTGQNAEAPDGLRFVVRTDENERVTVYAGPRDQVAQSLNLYRGDQVTIKGARCQIDDQQVIVATSIENGDQTYHLTQKNGVPKWESKNGKDQKDSEKQNKQSDQNRQRDPNER